MGHSLVDSALDFFLKHKSGRSIHILEDSTLEKGVYFVVIVKYLNGLSRTELLFCRVASENSVEIFNQQPVFFNEFAEKTINPADPLTISTMEKDLLSRDSAQTREQLIIEEKWAVALPALQGEATLRAGKLKEELHTIFKKEEYKIEISFFKKIRQLEEKRDRQRMKYRMDPRLEVKSALTRTENELIRTRHEMELELDRIRRESRVETELKLLQVYQVA